VLFEWDGLSSWHFGKSRLLGNEELLGMNALLGDVTMQDFGKCGVFLAEALLLFIVCHRLITPRP
jgi:hypothetical protein